MKKLIVGVLVLLLVVGIEAFADGDRGFVSDRPGAADNPITDVDGHYRIELGVFNFVEQRSGSADAKERDFLTPVLVRGMGSRSELGVGGTLYSISDTTDGSTHSREETSGPVFLRWKYNLIGDDGGAFAAAFLPLVQYDGESGENQWLGGVEFPLAYAFNSRWSFALTPQWTYDGLGKSGGVSSYYFGSCLGYNVTDDLNVFLQHAAFLDDFGKYSASYGAGFAYKLTPTIQIDMTGAFGKIDHADDKEFSAGVVFGL